MLPEISIHLNQKEVLQAIEFEDIIINEKNPQENQLGIKNSLTGNVMLSNLDEPLQAFIQSIQTKIDKQISKIIKIFHVFKVFVMYKSKNLFIYRAYYNEKEKKLFLKTLFSTELNYKEVKNYILVIEEKNYLENKISEFFQHTQLIKL
jgi:hypothetical protein